MKMRMRFCRVAAFLLTLLMIMMFATVAFAEEETTVDTSKLENMLQIANKAKESKYTAESWQVLQDAVAQANTALNSGDQAAVDAAFAALSSALANVKSMDYSAVEDAIANVDKFMEENEIGGYWKEIQDAIEYAQLLYESGNQNAVNRAAEQINLKLDAMRQHLDSEEKTTPVLWIVLLCVSVAGNLALGVVLVLKLRGNRNQVDDMPLVDYDIDDDIA